MTDETEIPYQRRPQIEQLLGEKANAEAYGQTGRAAAAQKGLDALGYHPPTKKAEAAEQRKAAAEESGEDEKQTRSTPPQGRTAAPKQKT